jgi:parallel beta-helix repeat protein
MRSGGFGRIVLVLSIMSLAFMVPHSPFFARSSPNTIYVPQQYPTIQLAVNAANPGDTIIVSPSPSGTYPGNISITKSLTLTGTSSSSVIINGSNINPGIVVSATSGVSISQVTIVDPDSAGNGISVLSSLDVSITGIAVLSTLRGTGAFGIWLSNSNNVVVSHDMIGGNLYGVAVQGGFSNSIRADNLTGNRAADIFLNATTGNQVKSNILAKSQIGIDMLQGSNGNVVTNNTVVDRNSLAGIFLSGSSSNQFTANNIDFNNSTSSTTGIHLENSSGNSFYYNNIRNNSIQIFAVYSSDLTSNKWDDGAVNPRGNYWSGYTGVDNDADGVGDTNVPWPCPNGGRPCSTAGPAGVDYYPLMSPVMPPSISVTAAGVPLSGCSVPSPLKVNLTSSATGGSQFYSFRWRFGDGGVTSGQNVTHSYTGRGLFFATVMVNDTVVLNSSASDTVTIVAFSGGLTLRVVDDAKNTVGRANVTSVAQPPGQAIVRSLTNSTGAALFSCLAPGPYTLQVSKPGFVTLQKTILISNSTVSQTLTLVRAQSAFPWALLAYVGTGVALAAILVTGAFLWRRSKQGRIATASPQIQG